MKSLKSLLAVLTALCLLTGCGSSADDGNGGEERSEHKSSETESSNDKDDDSESDEDSTDSEETKSKSCRKMIGTKKYPEVTAVIFTAESIGSLKDNSSVSESGNVIHQGVVGRVGAPIELVFNKWVTPQKLTFCYDKDELRGIPEKNLIVLHYNEDDAFYDTVEGSVLDTDACTIECEVSEEGAYLLADAYQWYACWGADVSEYAYDIDVTAYGSDWERKYDTGDIMDIADKDWAADTAPYFNVSTPEQLAGAVWYVNAVMDYDNGDGVCITLTSDIDLSDYDWVPMGWYDGGTSHAFSGTIDGGGHTVTGMHIGPGYDDSGFIGYGLSTYVTDIAFRDCSVNGGSCTGIVGGQVYMSQQWDSITLTDCAVEGASSDSGTIIGREAGTAFKDCAVNNVTVNGEETPYFSYRQKQIEETPVTETFTITVDEDGVIHRDVHDGFRNLGWHFEKNGVQLLDRLAENETEYDAAWIDYDKAYLTAFIDGTYIRVSNIIEK